MYFYPQSYDQCSPQVEKQAVRSSPENLLSYFLEPGIHTKPQSSQFLFFSEMILMFCYLGRLFYRVNWGGGVLVSGQSLLTFYQIMQFFQKSFGNSSLNWALVLLVVIPTSLNHILPFHDFPILTWDVQGFLIQK